MVFGIVDDSAYEKITENAKADYFDLKKLNEKIKNEFDELKSLKNTDINFLYQNFENEINMLEEATNRIYDYFYVLSGVKEQNDRTMQESTNNLDLYLNKMEGND